jgi:hypothetical protein
MIRKTILLLILGLGFTQVFSQEIKETAVPERCKQTVKNIFPQLLSGKVGLKWEKKGINYKASLTAGSISCVLMDSVAKIIYIEEQVNSREIPAKAIENLKLQYPDMEITDFYRITDGKSYITYRASILCKPILNDRFEVVKPKPVLPGTK